jgi:predicted RNA-binding Zn ribbon-like protein
MARPHKRKTWSEALEPAPGELALVQAFLNTEDRLVRVDELSSPEGLRQWLLRHQLVSPDLAVDPEHLRTARQLRDELRNLAHAETTGSSADEAFTRLNQLAAVCALCTLFSSDGVQLTSAADGVEGALGRVLAAVALARLRGDWNRLKLCESADCRRAYYDRSRNRSSRWCSRRYCGSRVNARRFRRRGGFASVSLGREAPQKKT